MKKIYLSILCVCAIFIAFSSPIYASHEEITPLKDEFKILDDTTLENTKTDEVYVFCNSEERDDFLNELEQQSLSLCACLPGDPGYPNCTDRYIVKTERQTTGATINDSGYISSPTLLCGNNGWVYGPGNISYSGNASASFTYNNISFSYSVTKGATFYVPTGYKGNIKYKAHFKLVPSRYKYTWNTGEVTYSSNFYVSTLLDGGLYLYQLKV